MVSNVNLSVSTLQRTAVTHALSASVRSSCRSPTTRLIHRAIAAKQAALTGLPTLLSWYLITCHSAQRTLRCRNKLPKVADASCVYVIVGFLNRPRYACRLWHRQRASDKLELCDKTALAQHEFCFCCSIKLPFKHFELSRRAVGI